MQLVVATQNQGKLKEIRRVLADCGIEVVGMDSFADLVPAQEDGETFADNAHKKALAIARQTGMLCLADDSGLTVAALDGRPGVYSARYAGEGSTDAQNNALLIEELAGVPEPRRQAAFWCVMALCTPDDDCQLFEGRIEGRILDQAQGQGGFGYDPLFFVESHGCTMAELPLDEKNRISHRGQALQKVVAALKSL
ncbi:XTP/dITP diphosphatase [Desulfuromonas acetoxidans]|uniref:dITP/XTP pyrophosphatase n=1 Tax=Desulfuromonas acetoxidans (strain DSM 684 / 11070) TaxID=281689 RepID=Q1K0X7_DESA6|nr:XTP/dITP diphosphatase [Desulfuromonas acetoxidans]EAT16231.1 Ham1-like protein [Desulfuromonas acetoxidans DSM 684]MBF0645195.1 XTP/dITP diphosphatase [Desulfuromonas acetoxidans]NVD23061.1 XTP/dITP diphosphatase [Desulfuromonas acetoxidans]NVE15698.1 XTP/dITP diphosphatase [Desulfuromonas acetoxidans]